MSIDITSNIVPEYLKNSEFYKNNLKNDNNVCISIDKKYFKENTDVNNLDEFKNLYYTCNYWLLDFPQSFYDFALENKKNVLIFLKQNNIYLHDELNKILNIDIKYKISATDSNDIYYFLHLYFCNQNIPLFVCKGMIYGKDYYLYDDQLINVIDSKFDINNFKLLKNKIIMRFYDNKIFYFENNYLYIVDSYNEYVDIYSPSLTFKLYISKFNQEKILKILNSIIKDIDKLPKSYIDNRTEEEIKFLKSGYRYIDFNAGNFESMYFLMSNFNEDFEDEGIISKNKNCRKNLLKKIHNSISYKLNPHNDEEEAISESDDENNDEEKAMSNSDDENENENKNENDGEEAICYSDDKNENERNIL